MAKLKVATTVIRGETWGWVLLKQWMQLYISIDITNTLPKKILFIIALVRVPMNIGHFVWITYGQTMWIRIPVRTAFSLFREVVALMSTKVCFILYKDCALWQNRQGK
jgi:hypothetical protein